MRSDSPQSSRILCELALGPLRWRFVSIREARDSDSDDVFTTQNFVDRLRALIDRALRDGCTRAEVDAALGQYIHGDHHGDA